MQFDDYGAVLMVSGKTGDRRVRIIASAPKLASWIETHPLRKSADAPLWVNFSTNNQHGNLSYAAAKIMLKEGAEKAGIKKLMGFIKISGEPEKVFKELKSLEELGELKEVVSRLKSLGVDSKVKVDMSLARGLDYYTGTIFEIFAGEGIGSVAGGGRYDKMIGLFLGRDVPAVGISLGIERIMKVMDERKMVVMSTFQLYTRRALPGKPSLPHGNANS